MDRRKAAHRLARVHLLVLVILWFARLRGFMLSRSDITPLIQPLLAGLMLVLGLLHVPYRGEVAEIYRERGLLGKPTVLALAGLWFAVVGLVLLLRSF